MSERKLISISGPDRVNFLQGLVTNDVKRATPDTLVYAALLSPQGKYLADFLILAQADALILDVANGHAAALAQRLSMYRLRADIDITESPLQVAHDADGLADPRHPDLPHRTYGARAGTPDPLAIRVAHVIPETGLELTPDTYILEAGFERLNGVDFRKGCYVGQEVTARMKHKTELKKGLTQVAITGAAPVGTAITNGTRPAGTLFSQHDGLALAYLRFDRMGDGMQAGDATLSPVTP